VTPPTIAQFRSDFSEFSDTSKYPDALVLLWLTIASFQVQNTERWATLLPTAQELVTAHYLVISARDRAAGAAGATPGLPMGLVTAESAADLSTTYDFTSLLYADAGTWNQTTYGQRYYSLARMIGAGGMQLPTGCCAGPGEFNPCF
jgi:hypothetical protein